MSKSKSTIIDVAHLDHITPNQYIEKWDEYARAALHGCLSFHGADGSCTDAGTSHIALIADQMMIARMERVIGIKEAQLAAKEEEKQEKTQSKR